MTYLSQFPKAKLKPGAPLRPKLNPKKARAYGPGEPEAECSWGHLLPVGPHPLKCQLLGNLPSCGRRVINCPPQVRQEWVRAD